MVKSKLLDQVQHLIRVKHFSIRTEQVYVYWIWKFILFHEKRHPSKKNKPDEQIRELPCNQEESLGFQASR